MSARKADVSYIGALQRNKSQVRSPARNSTNLKPPALTSTSKRRSEQRRDAVLRRLQEQLQVRQGQRSIILSVHMFKNASLSN